PAHSLRVLVRWTQWSIAPEIEIDDHVLAVGHGRHEGKQRTQGPLEVGGLAVGREQVDPAAVEHVRAPRYRTSGFREDREILEIADPVVAPNQDLQERLPHGRGLALEAG